MTVQKEVQESVTELDRARFAYHTEESECIKTAERAEEAELKAKGILGWMNDWTSLVSI